MIVDYTLFGFLIDLMKLIEFLDLVGSISDTLHSLHKEIILLLTHLLHIIELISRYFSEKVFLRNFKKKDLSMCNDRERHLFIPIE
jgi:hypothetical protein